MEGNPIFQEFGLEFIKSKSNKSLVLVELLCDLPSNSNDTTLEPSIPNESLFFIKSSDPWYGYFIIYLQTQTFRPDTSHYKQRHIRYQANIILSSVIHCIIMVSILF